MVERVSSASFHQTNLRNLSDRFVSLADLNRQISSGKRADSFVDLNGVVEQVSNFETKIRRNEAYIQNNNIIKTRLNTMNEAISQLQNIATSFKAEISSSSALNPEANLAQNSKAAIAKVLDQLNIDISGRYLFSGSRTGTSPVANPPVTAVAGEADSGYYKGKVDILTARVSDSLEIEYGVTADDEGFKNLISGINTAMRAAETGNSSLLQEAGNLIDKAVGGLAQARARVNSNILITEDINTQHERVNLVFKQSLSAEVDTDIASATIQLSSDQTVLQATFSAFARISSLKLSDFLN